LSADKLLPGRYLKQKDTSGEFAFRVAKIAKKLFKKFHTHRGEKIPERSLMATSNLPLLIDLNAVTKAYKTDAGLFMALKGIDLHINAGEFVAIVGKSGSGKTTLINMITGLDRPTEARSLSVGRRSRNWARTSSPSGADARSVWSSSSFNCFPH